MKKIIKLIALLMAVTMVAGLGACNRDTTVKFSIDSSKTYLYFESRTKEYSLPEIKCSDDKAQFTHSWKVKSGGEYVTIMPNDKFCVAADNGTAVLEASVIYDSIANYAVLTYEIAVSYEERSGVVRDISSSQLANADYAANGIAKKRVFGLYDYVYSESAKAYSIQSGSDAFHVSTPGYADDVELTAESSNASVASAQINGYDVQVTFLKAGSATITVKSTVPYSLGRYAYYSYTYNVVDAVNCYNYAQIAALDSAAQKNIANAKSVVIRGDIKTTAQATRFYGNVYGNGYQLDATAYAESHANYPNSPRPEEGKNSEDQAAFYMMSNNTVMDNIALMGDSETKKNLSLYGVGQNGLNYRFIGVAGIYGWWESGEKTRPQNIVFKNTVFEKGNKLVRISGANDPSKPIVFDTCVFRKAGHHAIYLASDEGVEVTKNPANDFEKAKEITNYVTLNNIITYESRLPPVGMQGSSGDDFGSAYGKVGSYKKSNQVTLTGLSNYFFSWLTKEAIEYGSTDIVGNIIVLGDEIRWALEKSANEPMTRLIACEQDGTAFSDPTNPSLNPYFNVVFFGNYGEANKVILAGSNYEGILSTEGGQRWKSNSGDRIDDNEPNSGLHVPVSFNLVIPILGGIPIHVTLSLWMQYNIPNSAQTQGNNVFYAAFQNEDNINMCVAAMVPAL